ncbi:hypothetical protein B9Z55_007166 [Caenorhabditis nigoni]|uniref:One cut domain family member n=1 Tax=Caenorhabditis nigoni TaxID=1611254 RepID=A0A2G5V937_9PELO|nr:hypothetical protein B9Z55_007166 [Caenorhabditis nigoni]
MYQNWREMDSRAAITSSNCYPPVFGTATFWDTRSLEVYPTRSSVSPYAPITHQYPTYEHQYLSQNDPWSAFSSATNYNSDVPNFKQNPAPYYQDFSEQTIPFRPTNSMPRGTERIYEILEEARRELMASNATDQGYRQSATSRFVGKQEAFDMESPEGRMRFDGTLPDDVSSTKAKKKANKTEKGQQTPTAVNTKTIEKYNDLLSTPLPDDFNLDTKQLCDAVLKEMVIHEISQGILARRVINRSQGTLSAILNKPKPWSFIGAAGRQTFVRLYNWINLPEKKRLEIVNKNTVWDVPEEKNEKKCDKRKRKSTDEPSTTKRARIEFTNVQRQVLEAIYEKTDRPTADVIQMIAEKLDLDETTVSNYFQNTRTRNKAKADIEKGH